MVASPTRHLVVLVRTAAAVGVAAALAACAGTPNGPTAPTVASVRFAPKLVLDVTDDGARWRAGPAADDAVQVDPARARQGTVLEIANDSAGDRRVVGDDGKVFDTGTLRPGERVTVALTSPITAEQTIVVRVEGGRGDTTALVEVPRPTS
ncbi:MAG: hypothetical protein U0Q07_15790 [Acidimicrobiales bacterium]